MGNTISVVVRAVRHRWSGYAGTSCPTEQLVVRGLYRYVRNLMYLAVLAIITGQRSVSVNDHG
jgi:protein-S-isoprenylcysteine O-methyltransferase Ste14